MTETTPAPDAGRDATLDLLVPPRSRRRRNATIAAGAATLVGAIVVSTWWPGVADVGFSYVGADGSRDAHGTASVFIVERPGPDVPVTLESVEAPRGWRIVHAGVAAPSADIHDDAGPEHLALPAPLTHRSRVVVAWQLDCPAALELVRENPSVVSTSLERAGEAPEGTTLHLWPMTAAAHVKLLGFLPATLGKGPDATWVSRTPGLDLAVECGLDAEQVRALRADVR